MLVPYAGYEPPPKNTWRNAGRPKLPTRTACPILRELFRICDTKNYSNRQIADALDVSQVCICYWRRGRCIPDMPTYLEFAKFLGVELGVIGARR
jgi:hypothetical protein